ncbi:hypothetical protein [Burkholderia aenigmatica]|uniref:hypothetical protein n=1 Tax=Burkholderia aenigmatica TaxID=2015348 RepID=UPI00265539E8|nr:hypothetical protein [Burkholderia aenigmatica]MDN7881415.1 hypothetical protein [Burkholderia aenigmatica]
MKPEFEEHHSSATELALLCPKCRTSALHHGAVEVFVRKCEDSNQGMHTTVAESLEPRTDFDMRLNPSARRDGVLIHLHCENGCGNFVLAIVQHKGNTHLKIGTVAPQISWGRDA